MAKRKNDAQSEKVNKSEEVRQMLGTMGLDASPKEVASRLNERGIDVKPAFVSQIKGKLKQQQEQGQDGGQAGTPTPAQKPAPAAEGVQVDLTDVARVRELAQKMGADNLKKLVDAVSG